MMSPDGKWVWDGHQWLPVAVHESVFPAYGQATAAAAAEPVPAVDVRSPFNPFSAAPAPAVVSPAIIAPPASYTAGGATPPWIPQGLARQSRAMYIGAAFLTVVIGVVFTIFLVQSQLPFLRASNGQGSSVASPAATPTPQLAVRSQFAIADRYIKTVITPAVSKLDSPLTLEHESCNGTLSFSCQDALNATDTALTASIASLKPGPPACIVRQVAKIQADINAMAAAVKAGLKGYADNNRNELAQALSRFNAANKPLQADVQAAIKAQATVCDGQQEGP